MIASVISNEFIWFKSDFEWVQMISIDSEYVQDWFQMISMIFCELKIDIEWLPIMSSDFKSSRA